MAASNIRVGDRVRVETVSYEGIVQSYDHLTQEMHVLTHDGHNHYFDPTHANAMLTIVPPPFKTGQVWETPDGNYWFIRRAASNGFCAMTTGQGISCSKQDVFLASQPRLIFPTP